MGRPCPHLGQRLRPGSLYSRRTHPRRRSTHTRASTIRRPPSISSPARRSSRNQPQAADGRLPAQPQPTVTLPAQPHPRVGRRRPIRGSRARATSAGEHAAASNHRQQPFRTRQPSRKQTATSNRSRHCPEVGHQSRVLSSGGQPQRRAVHARATPARDRPSGEQPQAGLFTHGQPPPGTSSDGHPRAGPCERRSTPARSCSARGNHRRKRSAAGNPSAEPSERRATTAAERSEGAKGVRVAEPPLAASEALPHKRRRRPGPRFPRTRVAYRLRGRYWDRTSDLFRVREARYRCANRPNNTTQHTLT